MGLFSTDNCPICEKATNAFKKTMVKIDNKFLCRDCLLKLNSKGINVWEFKKYTTKALKNIVNNTVSNNNFKKDITKIGNINISEFMLNISNVNEVKKRYYAFDVETTGLNSYSDRIIELGVVLFENGVPVNSFGSLINAEVNISAEASRVNNITNSMIENAPKEKEV